MDGAHPSNLSPRRRLTQRSVLQDPNLGPFSPVGKVIAHRSGPALPHTRGREKAGQRKLETPCAHENRMCDTPEEKGGWKAIQRALSPLPSSVYYNDELPCGSPDSKPVTRIRFLPRELPEGVSTPSAVSSATMETHVLDVESPGATLERKVR